MADHKSGYRGPAKTKPGEKWQKILVYLVPGQLEELDAWAAEEDRSRSYILRDLINKERKRRQE
jgi:Ribbon-helix-helix protein, copG family